MTRVVNLILSLLLFVAVIVIILQWVENRKYKAREFNFERKIDSLNVVIKETDFKLSQIPQIIEKEKKVYITKRETVKVMQTIPVVVEEKHKIYRGVRNWNLWEWINFTDTILFDFKAFNIASYYWLDSPLMIFIFEKIDPKSKKIEQRIYIEPNEPAKFINFYVSREWVNKPAVYLNAGILGKEPSLGLTFTWRRLNWNFYFSRKDYLIGLGYRIY